MPKMVPLSGTVTTSVPLKALQLVADNGVAIREPRLFSPTFSYAFDLVPGYKHRIWAKIATETSKCSNLVLADVIARANTSLKADLAVPLKIWKGTVTVPGRTFLAGFVVYARGANAYTLEPGCEGMASTDWQGRFELPVIPGSYNLTIRAPLDIGKPTVVFSGEVVGSQGLEKSYVFTG